MTASINLASLLRSETKDLHTAAERAGIMPAFLRGQLDLPGYCHLLRNFHAIYSALESALAHHAALPLLRSVQFDGLNRERAIAADLSSLFGSHWAALPLADSGASYAKHIDQLCHYASFLPPHLKYLASYFGKRTLNLLFPVSVTAGTIIAAALWQTALGAGSTPHQVAANCLLATLLTLAVLEHWFLVLPLPVEGMWRWAMRSHRATAGTATK